MKVQRMKVEEVHADPANVRRHSTRNLDAVKASLARFGQQRPIVVDANGVVRAGNATLEAARALGWEHVDVVRTGLKGSEATAYAIADNRTAELAEWDFEGLAETIRGLEEDEFDLSVLGWADYELEPLLQAEWSPPALEDLPGVGADGGPGGEDGHVIRFSAEAWETVHRAIVRRRGGDDLTDAECIGAICGEYLTTPGA